jgi:DNA-binding Lrp family transcriptional regulator
LASNPRLTTRDFAELTTLSSPAALTLLNRLEADGVIQRGDSTKGRSAHFVAG